MTRPIDRLNVERWVRALRKDGVKIDWGNKKMLITQTPHPINEERIKELTRRNGFKSYEQLSLF